MLRSPQAQAMACAAFMVLSAAAVAAQPPAGPAPAPPTSPPAPTLPFTISRDDQGRATVRAVRVTTPMRIDGQLDEAIYTQVQPASDFIQMEPHGGQPATEKTEVWVFFDEDNVYVVFRCWESQPERTRRQRDAPRQRQHPPGRLDRVLVRHLPRPPQRHPVRGQPARRPHRRPDHQRAAVQRRLEPGLGRRGRRFDGGWTIEAAMPFKSIRYAPGTAQVWGFQARRTNKWKNEISYLTRCRPSLGLGRADFSASLYATLVGIEAPPLSRTLELKPYAIGERDDATTRRRRSGTNDLGGDVGVDAKYAVTQNLTADLTYNTDFAQVEADEQQVNLTRFSLFFPEKREFFLENQGMFTFGGDSCGGTATAANSRRARSCSTAAASGSASSREVPTRRRRAPDRPRRAATASASLNMQTREDEPAAERRADQLLRRARASATSCGAAASA